MTILIVLFLPFGNSYSHFILKELAKLLQKQEDDVSLNFDLHSRGIFVFDLCIEMWHVKVYCKQ